MQVHDSDGREKLVAVVKVDAGDLIRELQELNANLERLPCMRRSAKDGASRSADGCCVGTS